MFDIPELDDMVCSKLDQTALSRCAQVSKKWSKRTISTRGTNTWYSSRRLKARKSTKVTKTVGHASESLEQEPLALTKYGRYVRQVESFTVLASCLEQELVFGGESRPMEYFGGDLIRHFLKRCPHALMQYKLFYEHVKSAAIFAVVLEALPRVSTLTINGSNDHRTPFPVPKLKQILAASSNNLASLTIHIGRLRDVKKGGTKIPAILDITARPRHLNLCKLETDGFNVGDLSWFWRACGQVEELEVSRLSDDAMLSVILGIRGSMPLLDIATLDKIFGGCGGFEIDDLYIRAILEAGTKGLEAVHCAARARMGPQAFKTLLQHASTLKEFTVGVVQNRSDVLRVLKSCPNLRKLTALDNECYWSNSFPEVGATDFIDWEPEVKAPRPWPCKTTLETLAIKVTITPRQGSSADGPQAEDFRFHETQRRVCERLSEFTNLKFLRLGHTANLIELETRVQSRRGWHTVAKQTSCAHLTLATGLGKLERLRELEELHIPNMNHQVKEVLEVEWMVENWPKLWKIIGLDRESHAYKWLEAKHPEIRLEEPSSG